MIGCLTGKFPNGDLSQYFRTKIPQNRPVLKCPRSGFRIGDFRTDFFGAWAIVSLAEFQPKTPCSLQLIDFAHRFSLTVSRPTNSLGSVKLSSLSFQPQAPSSSKQSIGVSQTTTCTDLRSAQEYAHTSHFQVNWSNQARYLDCHSSQTSLLYNPQGHENDKLIIE